jgi:hypothetical protein
MDSLEKEILKYEKKEFKVQQKRTLKYGSRTFLKKKGGFLGTDTCVYIYYVDGNASTDSFREFFKDYAKSYQEANFDSGDKGLFLCSGNCDEKLFKDLRKAMIRDENVRNSIKLLGLGETTEKEVKEKQPRREAKEATGESSEILSRIKKFTIHKKPKTEKDLDSMLVHYLSAFYPDIQTQLAYQNARIDAQIGDVGIEIKFQPSAGEFDRLYGQTEKYLKSLEKVIVVIGYERTRELTENFEKRMKERGWFNSKVFVVSLR